MIGTKKQIRLINITSVQNAVTGRWEETETAYNLWAEPVKTGSGRSADNGQTSLQNTVRFKIFFRQAFDVNANWRIVYKGRQYTITGIDELDERRFYYQITATASGKS